MEREAVGVRVPCAAESAADAIRRAIASCPPGASVQIVSARHSGSYTTVAGLAALLAAFDAGRVADG